MVLSEKQKKYPICDTDIWIKNAKYNKLDEKELIFNRFEAVFMPDAVRQELGREGRLSYIEDFKCGLEKFKEDYSIGRVHVLGLCNEKFFDQKKRDYVKVLFHNNDIYFDEERQRFSGTSANLGERVAVIYAWVGDFKIILSDDSHAVKFIDSKFPYLKSSVINFHNLLRLNNFKDNEIFKIKKKINQPLGETDNAISEGETGINLMNYKSKFIKQ